MRPARRPRCAGAAVLSLSAAAAAAEAGAPVGPEFEVGTQAGTAPAVAGRGPGDFVVVWQNNGQDGSGDGVFGQRYGDLIFSDGFNLAF